MVTDMAACIYGTTGKAKELESKGIGTAHNSTKME